MKVDPKFNFLNSENVSLGTKLGYSSITTTAHTPTGGNDQFQTKNYNIVSNNWQDSNPKLRAVIKFALYKEGGDVLPPGDEGDDVKDNVGLASYALNRIIKTCKVKMGDLEPSTSISKYIDLYASSLDNEVSYEVSPVAYPDSSSQFNNGALDDPLRWKGDSSKAYGTSRGFGQNYKVSFSAIQNATGSMTHKWYEVTIEYDECLMANPFQWMEKHPVPFKGLGSYTITLDFESNPLDRMININRNAVNGLPSYKVAESPNGSPFNLKILTRTYTPHLNLNVPNVLYYNTPSIENFPQSFSALDNTKSAVQTLNNVNLKVIPSMFALCVYDESSLSDPSRPFSTFNIKNVSLKVGDKSGLMSELSQRDLYEMSIRHGYKLGFDSFSGSRRNPLDSTKGNGSNCWLFFDMSDISSENLDVSNANRISDITVTVTYENNLGEKRTPTCNLFIVRDKVYINEAGQWSDILPSLDDVQIENAKLEYANMDYSNNVLGGKGKFWRGLKNFAHKLTSKPVRNIVRAVRKSPLGAVLPNAVHQVADVAGYGVVRSAGKRKAPAKRKPAKRKPAKRKGGAVVRSAGKKMTKAQMRKRYGV